MADPFKVLELPNTASQQEVKARYRELAKRYHPDAGAEPSAERMTAINQAYEELARDLDGCRRKYGARTYSSTGTGSRPRGTASRGRSSRGSRGTRRPPSSPREPDRPPQTPAKFWQDWLEWVRRAGTAGKPTAPRTSGQRPNLKVTPSVLTLCRAHGAQEFKVRGADSELVRVRFSTSHLEVKRQPAEADAQSFRVQLTDNQTSPGDHLTIELRTASGGLRRVPIYEFSCPSAEGACAFAS